MYALFIILNKVDYLDDVLSALVKYKVKGATIVDSQGMASAIINNGIKGIPLFGSLKSLLGDPHPYNKTIFTVLKKEIVEDVVAEVRTVLGDIKGPGVGFMFTVPVGDIYLLDDSHKK